MQKATLVLVHGYPFDHHMWDAVIASLGKTVPILALDLPGFGGRPLLPVEPSIEALADDLATELARRKIERVVLAGMSMGGYVALAFAERHASQVAALGIVSSQSIADTDEIRAGRLAMISKVATDGPDAAVEAAIPKLFSPQNARNNALTAIPHAGARSAGVEGIQWALRAMAGRQDRTGVLRALRVPISIIHGTEDQLIPVDRALQLAESLPGAEWAPIPGAGHATPLEAPTEVASALQRLCARTQA
jgi:pimeloyl-ACP methyl ester carboxylesterase